MSGDIGGIKRVRLKALPPSKRPPGPPPTKQGLLNEGIKIQHHLAIVVPSKFFGTARNGEAWWFVCMYTRYIPARSYTCTAQARTELSVCACLGPRETTNCPAEGAGQMVTKRPLRAKWPRIFNPSAILAQALLKACVLMFLIPARPDPAWGKSGVAFSSVSGE